MAKYLIIAEQREGNLKKVALECIGAAQKLAAQDGGTVDAVVIGKGASGVASTVGKYGVGTVYAVDGDAFGAYSGQGFANALAPIVKEKGYDTVFLGMSSWGKDLAPRLAAKLGAGLASDVTGLELKDGKLVVIRPVYAGKAFAKVGFKSSVKMATLRPNAFPAAKESGSAKVEAVAADPGDPGAKVTGFQAKGGETVELTEASVVVSGGRGIKGPENFHLITDLAKVLKGAAGASRAIVDAGWVDHSLQVGQTGKVVAPNLYIAAGISGAIQHLAGMSSSKVIVAINKDGEAPIFNVANYGVVGDLFEILPKLTEEFKKLLAD